MTQPESMSSSEFTSDSGSYCLNGDAVNHTVDISDGLLERILALGDSYIDFLANAGNSFNKALETLTEERENPDYMPLCRKPDNCRACVGGTFGGTRVTARSEGSETLDGDMALGVSCKAAMTRANDRTRTGQAPVELYEIPHRKGIKGVREEKYQGVRQLDNGCYLEMGALANRMAELIALEIGEYEMPPKEAIR